MQTLAVGLSGLRQDGDANPSRRGLVFAWLLLYIFVGCQMAWTLRPFVGSPYLVEFEALRPRSSNFYANVIGSVGKLGGHEEVVGSAAPRYSSRGLLRK